MQFHKLAIVRSFNLIFTEHYRYNHQIVLFSEHA